MKNYSNEGIQAFVGLDSSDKKLCFCVLDQNAQIVQEGKLVNRRDVLSKFLSQLPRPSRVVVEAGTHSLWISREIEQCGHQGIVANARKLELLSKNDYKDDPIDAEYLARMGRSDVKLLHPIEHRGEQAQADLALIKSRDLLVRSRTRSILHVRGTVKPLGGRIPGCSAESFPKQARAHIPAELRPSLLPILQNIARLTAQIRQYDRRIAKIAKQYDGAQVVQQVAGVGDLVSTAFVLTIEDPGRLARSRKAGPFLGMVRRRHKSGESDPDQRISKAGNGLVRRLLVQSAHYIMGAHGPDSDLRRFGLALYQRGGQTRLAKRKAALAVARKLAVLMHHLWLTGECYDPLYQAKRRGLAPEAVEVAQ